MLINLSNHPSSKWSKEQTEAALHYGEIADLPFPVVAPEGDENYIAALADEYCNKVVELAGGAPVTVHLMGGNDPHFRPGETVSRKRHQLRCGNHRTGSRRG